MKYHLFHYMILLFICSTCCYVESFVRFGLTTKLKHGHKRGDVHIHHPSIHVLSSASGNPDHHPDYHHDDDTEQHTQYHPINIQVFDNVFDTTACRALHEMAVEHAWRCESSIFSVDQEHKTPLEQTIQQVLQQIDIANNDDNDSGHKFVEYWSRDEYMNIDAHVDVDEGELEEDGILRCPDYSHILYLQISQTAPTCILLDNNGDYHPFKNQATTTKATNTTTTKKATNLVTVPCVEGRLVRFPGNLLHAVPRPPDRWLLSTEEWKSLLQQEQEEDMVFHDDDDDDDVHDEDNDEEEQEDQQIERSVLLFNTWSTKAPRDVLPDIPKIPDGIHIEGVDDILLPQQILTLEDQQTDCNPRNTWIQREIPSITQTVHSDDPEIFRISLMGKRRRRHYATKDIFRTVSSHLLRSAVHQQTDISHMELHNPTEE